MYSFLFYQGPQAEQVLRKASAISRRVMPTFGKHVTTETRLFPDQHAGWFFHRPDPAERRAYVSEFVHKDVGVLAFGVPMDGSEASLAATVGSAWLEGSTARVRVLDESFSAVIVDLRQSGIWFLSDPVGLRPLRYFEDEGRLWISPHDVPIVAAAPCSTAIDVLSAYAILRMRWSLNGTPLLSDIRATDPGKYYTWQSKKVQALSAPLFSERNRLDVHDKPGKEKLISAMIDQMTTLTSEIARHHHDVTLDLTAGMDTRAIAALLLRSFSNDRISTYTYGSTSDADVSIGAWIAEKYGLQHDLIGIIIRDEQERTKELEALAYATNGQGTSARLFGTGSLVRPSLPRFTGHNAGLHKGFYYPNKFVTKASIEESFQPGEHLTKHMLRTTKFLHTQELDAALIQKLQETMTRLGQISENPHDILDLFYLTERNCHYGSYDTAANLPWVEDRYCLFESPVLIRMALEMPPPIAQNYALHREILRRYMPNAYRKVVNDTIFLPALFNPVVARWTKRVLEAKKRLRIKPDQNNMGQTQINASIREVATQCIDDPDGIAQHLFDQTSLFETLRHLPATNSSARFVLGHLITMHIWYRQVSEARRFALGDVALD